MANIPIIRFRGFTDNWEQRKFEEIFKLYQGLQISLSERFTEPGINRYFYITNEFLKDTCEEAYYIESPSENVVCNEEDILMTRTGNTGIVVTDVKGCFHNNFFKIKYDKDTFSKRYICYLLSTSYMQRVIMNSAGSSTIPDLSHKAFYKIVGYFPNSKEEQDKIGDNLANLDNLIILHQRKCDETKELKKYMLQKMFPKNGELIPEIRFAGFTDDWEQRKLDEWGSFYYGKSCPKWSVTEDATIPCIRYGELYTKFGAKIDRVYSYTNMLPDNLRFSKGTEVLIPRVGEDPMDYNHCTWLSMPNVAIGEMISVYNTENNPLFTAIMFNATLRNEFAMRVEGGSVTNLYFEKLKNIYVSFPTLEEQEKISSYFDNLDHLITLHQRKCDALKEVKRFMLQNMFPQKG